MPNDKEKKIKKNSTDPFVNYSATGRIAEPVSSNTSIKYNEQLKKAAKLNKKYPTSPFGGDRQ